MNGTGCSMAKTTGTQLAISINLENLIPVKFSNFHGIHRLILKSFKQAGTKTEEVLTHLPNNSDYAKNCL